MKRSVVGWIVAVVLAVGGAALAWLYFAGGSGEPSTELTTPPVAEATTTTGPEDDGAPAAESSTTTFVIDGSQSVASFEIDEVLRGADARAIGTTSEVAGQLVVDVDELASVQFSQIVVNARTLQTDSSFRDRAIRGPVILNSAEDEFEFITFDVTEVDGLDGSAVVEERLEFTITGDLVIRGTTRTTTFDVSARLTDESTIVGTAEAVVLRSDYDIGIPNAPGVAEVSDEVLIRLDFVAVSG